MALQQNDQPILELCAEINVPIADEKTEWASTCIIFLGILLDGEHFVLAIPVEKQRRALNLLQEVLSKKKVTVKQLQVLTGYLNFLTKAIIPGRTFTRRICSKFTTLQNHNGRKLKQHHHINIDQELRFDCEIWRTFLANFMSVSLCQPMVDLSKSTTTATELNFFSDASANKKLGFGAIYGKKWLCAQWEPNYIEKYNPSIEYLELVGVIGAMLLWGNLISNKSVIVFCDNTSTVAMINSMSSSCKNCMHLLHLLTLNNLVFNRRTFAKHVSGIENSLSDSLSHLQMDRFWRLVLKDMERHPSPLSRLIWPLSAIWQN